MVVFDKSILVVAHPDDEILWFNSLLNHVKEIVVCYLDYDPDPVLSKGRRKALSQYPIKILSCLEISEAGVFNDNNWINPKVTAFGMDIGDDRKSTRQYQENFHSLKAELFKKVKSCEHVFTHNPWGEYGHEEHVQVNSVIRSLQKEIGFDIWYPNYFSNKSAALMLDSVSHVSSDTITYDAQIEMAGSIKRLYEKNKCWTWYNDWQWLEKETFIRDDLHEEKGCRFSQVLPLNMIRVEVSRRSVVKASLLSRIMKKLK